MPPSIAPSSARLAGASMCRSCRNTQRLRISSRRNISSTPKRNATNPLASLNESLSKDKAATTSSNTPSTDQNSTLINRLRTLHEQQEATRLASETQTLRTSPYRPSAPPSTSTTPPTAPLRTTTNTALSDLFASARIEANTRTGTGIPLDEPYHIHVFAQKNNCHITFTDPNRNPILSFSCGNIGLKKAQRQSFDACYQLATYTMKKLAMASWRIGGKKASGSPLRTVRDVHGIEVVMRGFGPGREAFQKALLGSEGGLIRPLVKRVADSTRLKFGGARSPNVRRLG